MAKALYGHVGTVNQRLHDEVQRLRIKARDLEFEIARLQAVNDRLSAALNAQDAGKLTDEELRRITIQEPALT